MSLSEQITYDDLTRQERLIIWMRRMGTTRAKIGRALGIGTVAVGRLLFSERASSWRVQQFKEYGIPDELLPRVEDIPSGPKPSKNVSVAAPQ